VTPPGDWIQIRQVFITRLSEQRYPTRVELDVAAPRNPVIFSTGPDASLNSLALRESGIDREFRVTDGGPGFAEKDVITGEPTGILRSCTRYVKVRGSGTRPTSADQDRRLLELFRDYLASGITAICDRDASPDAIERYRKLRDAGKLPVRVVASHHVDTIGPIAEIQQKIRAVGAHPLRAPDPWLRIIGIKTYLDGGMLTGSAYMRQPWGVSKIYGITDPEYRGVLFIPRDRLVPIVRTAVESGLQFTAVHRALCRRRCGPCPVGRLRRGEPLGAGARHAAEHHPLELHERRGDPAGSGAGGLGGYPAGVAVPGHPHAGRAVRI
jgi:predicted amidohydrolase YtcJ